MQDFDGYLAACDVVINLRWPTFGETSGTMMRDFDRLGRYLHQWVASDSEQCRYLEGHIARLVRTLQLVPPGTPEDRILEMGCYLQITPALRRVLGYGEVRGCYLGSGGLDEK